MKQIRPLNRENRFDQVHLNNSNNQKKINYHTIIVTNQTNMPIKVNLQYSGIQIEAFGPRNINRQNFNCNTSGTIPTERSCFFNTPTNFIQSSKQSTNYYLYTYKLIVKFQNNDDSKVHFSEPLQKFPKSFVVKSHDTKLFLSV
jgi:hypothetical protein